MISKQDLKDLLALTPETESPVMSLYLNVDQSQAVNLNRRFEATLKSLIQQTEKGIQSDRDRDSFLEDASRVTTFVTDYQPEGKTLIVFCDDSRDFFWHRNLEIGLKSAVHLQHRPHLRPLFEARDEFERYGVILTDRARARLFIVVMNTIEEVRDTLAEAEVRKFDASGTDQLLSQMSFQRKADEHARRHLKNVADEMEKLAQSHRLDRLVLAGTNEVVAELRSLLSERLKKSVVGSLAMPVETGVTEILEETVQIQERFERKGEIELVSNLLTSAAKNQLAVVGSLATLEALIEARVRQLVYSERFAAQGGECCECGALFERLVNHCPRCSGSVRVAEDLLDAAVVKVVSEGGMVEQVRGEAAEELMRGGAGIGAFLRF